MNPQTNALTISLTYKLINIKPYKRTNSLTHTLKPSLTPKNEQALSATFALRAFV